MSKRSYQQFCPIAYSLDIVGERWTLLIVRELSLGPRRFSDLQRGLPGIGPNLLSARLKDLEEAGVTQRVYLPPPAKLTAYALTPSGQELLGAMGPLALWGLRFLLEQPPEGHYLSAVATMMALRLMFNPQDDPTFCVEVHLLPDIFGVAFAGGELTISLGTAAAPDLAIQCEAKGLLALASGVLPAEAALTSGTVTLLDGDKAVLTQFSRQFAGLPQLAA